MKIHRGSRLARWGLPVLGSILVVGGMLACDRTRWNGETSPTRSAPSLNGPESQAIEVPNPGSTGSGGASSSSAGSRKNTVGMRLFLASSAVDGLQGAFLRVKAVTISSAREPAKPSLRFGWPVTQEIDLASLKARGHGVDLPELVIPPGVYDAYDTLWIHLDSADAGRVVPVGAQTPRPLAVTGSPSQPNEEPSLRVVLPPASSATLGREGTVSALSVTVDLRPVTSDTSGNYVIRPDHAVAEVGERGTFVGSGFPIAFSAMCFFTSEAEREAAFSVGLVAGLSDLCPKTFVPIIAGTVTWRLAPAGMYYPALVGGGVSGSPERKRVAECRLQAGETVNLTASVGPQHCIPVK